MASTTTTKPTKTKEESPQAAPAKPRTLSEMTDVIDQSTFEQILEMDEEGEHDFSQGIVYGFFEQAESTFVKMETALKERQLGELSSLGHFLKGSSATIGLTKVKDACEKIQHYGAGKDETGANDEPDEKVSLEKIGKILETAKKDYKEAEDFLREYFGDAEPASPLPSS
ncbi:signal transduction histidine kinase [Aspergillus cavernicola]|uniref:Signal transduction histidine kinase n=1 Tax=Aspergillus cavernicola TaxID=176166 RepID=A0ABR4J508_9EURO